mmetsp:Transcript_12076/g.16341  ORF Transcript_12076/g.16341 Transcript_12076/m.16341 type:complete len:93 (+) Transcript_12076:131-409(+)
MKERIVHFTTTTTTTTAAGVRAATVCHTTKLARCPEESRQKTRTQRLRRRPGGAGRSLRTDPTLQAHLGRRRSRHGRQTGQFHSTPCRHPRR